jgi:hypothetical protein
MLMAENNDITDKDFWIRVGATVVVILIFSNINIAITYRWGIPEAVGAFLPTLLLSLPLPIISYFGGLMFGYRFKRKNVLNILFLNTFFVFLVICLGA